MPEILGSDRGPDFDQIELGDNTATRDGIWLVWAVLQEVLKRLGRVARGHNVLSETHRDSTSNPPLQGALISGTRVSVDDPTKFWIRGRMIGGPSVPEDVGAVKYWRRGAADAAALLTSDVTWARREVGIGVPYSASGEDWEWTAIEGLSGIGIEAATRAYLAADFALADTTETAIPLVTAADPNAMWSIVNPSRLTVPSGKAGTYLVIVAAAWDSGFVGASYIVIKKTGTEVARAWTGGGTNIPVPHYGHGHAVALVPLVEGDYVQGFVYHQANVAGTPALIRAGAARTYVHLAKVGT